jgi:polar amino acid transport system substrate-binding protein
MAAVLDLLQQRKLDVARLTTHRFTVEQAGDAYACFSDPDDRPIGIVLDYGLAGSTPTFVPSVRAATPSAGTSDRVRIALLGAGNFATGTLLPLLRERRDVDLRVVLSASGLSASSVAERGGFERCATGPEEIFHDPDVDLVLIASRHDSHAELTARALEAGKPVFVEKPLALSHVELRRIEAAYGEHPGFLMVGFNRRFAPLVSPLAGWLADVPEPLLLTYRVNAGYLARDHWVQADEGGGRILGEVCHFVDLLMYLSRAYPIDVHAVALPDVGRYSRDNMAATIRFENGSIGTIVYASNGHRSVAKERLEVFGGGRVAVLDDFRQLVLRGPSGGTTKSAPDKGHRAEMNALIDATKQGAPSPISFADLVATTRATLAIEESILTGQPIAIPR